MKRALYVLIASFIAIGLLCSCDTGGGTVPTPSPSPTPAPETPTNTWYAFAQQTWGLAKVRASYTFEADSFEELNEYWDGASWVLYCGLRGSLEKLTDTSYNATLESIYTPNYGTTGMDWKAAGTPDFDGYRPYVWSSVSNIALISLSGDSSQLTYQRDQDGDSSLSGAQDFEAALSKTSTSDLLGSGACPLVNYVGFNFHRSPTSAASHLEIMSMTNQAVDSSAASVVDSVSIKVTMPGGTESAALPLTWDSGENSWELDPYTFADPSGGGIWWISEVAIDFKGSAAAIYSVDSPYESYSALITTDTGFSFTMDSGMLAAQCSMPPNAAPVDSVMHYIETVANVSSGETDTKIFVYESNNLTNWIAVNDDGGPGAGVFADIAVALAAGHDYYIKVIELDGNAGDYSLVVNTGGFSDTPSAVSLLPGPDIYEDDDTPAGAKVITIDAAEPQHRTLTENDVDWVFIDLTP